MKKALLIAVFAVGLASAPAMASVQNVKVSGDINSTWLIRNNFDLGTDTNRDYNQNLLFTQTRLRVDADLTDNVSSTVGLLNERAWGDFVKGANNGDSVEINLAYVTLREMLYSPLTVTIGRQNFAFGNSFIIDSAGTNNSASAGGLKGVAEDFTEGTAQDAIRFTLDYNPLTIDAIYSKVANGSDLGLSPADDSDLFGVNANYQVGDKWQSVVEGYLWYRYTNNLTGGVKTGKADTVVLPGVHVSTNPIKGLNVQGEVAFQLGQHYASTATVTQQKRDAWATQWIANYMLPFEKTAKYDPVVTGVYTFLSGDKQGNDDNYTAWDPMYENQGAGTIYNTLFNLSNANIITLEAQAKPIKDVTTKVSYNNLWLANKIGGGSFALLQPDGSTASPAYSMKNRAIGQEVDVNVNYAYTEDVSMGLSAGWFFPGKLFSPDNNNTATQVLGNVAVNF